MRADRGALKRLAAAFTSLVLLFTLGPAQPASAAPAPGPPPNTVSVSQRATIAILSWPAISGATGYAIDYATDFSFNAANRATTSGTFILLTDLVPETQYYVRVAAWDAPSETTGEWSPAVAFTTGTPEFPLPAPVVALSSQSSTSITAEWSVGAAKLGYEVALGKDPKSPDKTTVVKANHTTINGLTRKTTYHVSVRALDEVGKPVSAWSDPAKQQTPASLPLRVGSYNIMCENCSKGKATWAKRRGPLVATIRAQDLDVIGVQEASIGRIPGGGYQYRDLINRLGSPYKLTESGRSVSPDVRVIYNSQRVKLIKEGVVALPRGPSRRFLSWAIFEQKSTGERFFFSNTHLEPKDGRRAWNTRKRQARSIVSATARLRDGLPVIAVGDYASTKWEKWGNAPYDVMQAAGFKDPLGNAYRSRSTAPGAFVEKRINTSYASYNMYKRNARNFSGHVNGSNNDFIFVSDMRVPEYEVVVNVNSAGQFVGVIPSDHNLIRATVLLP